MKQFEQMTLDERCAYILDTMKRISFYKEDGQWYADVEGHTKEENEMVAGADTFLDKVSQGRPYVSFNVSDKIYPKARFVFERIQHDDYGATYLILGQHPDAPGLSAEAQEYEGKMFWLCNVAHTVLGEHPEYISVI